MYHDEFHVPGPGPYALTHSVGCLPKRSAAAIAGKYLQPWQDHGGDAWPQWLSAIDEFRESLAALLGGDAADYCPQSNLSSGFAKLLPALPRRAGRTALVAAEDCFPSMAFVMQRAREIGYDTRLIPRAQDPSSMATWRDALTSEVAAVLVTHAHSNTGIVAPVADIAALSRQRGIVCMVDVAQSAGILPISVTDIGADVVLGSCVKWLCGGPGAGFMWIRPALSNQLKPTDVGWFSHDDPFEFDVHSFRFAPAARRFWGGTPSVVPYVAAAVAIRLLTEIGVEAVRKHNRELMHIFREQLPDSWRDRVALDGIGGTLCLPLGDAHEQLRGSFRAHAVRADFRGSAVRLSFHIYNTRAEAATVARCWSGI
jgi:selenocysteine lyase/cysteine desulfurase